jgi:hypothetical protein
MNDEVRASPQSRQANGGAVPLNMSMSLSSTTF